MKRAIPSLIGIIAVGACLRKAFSKATDDAADCFSDADPYLAGVVPIPSADAPGSRHTDRAQHLTLNANLDVVPLNHGASISPEAKQDHG